MNEECGELSCVFEFSVLIDPKEVITAVINSSHYNGVLYLRPSVFNLHLRSST